MSKLQLLHVFLNERLKAAALEIFGAVEKTVVEYQEENERLRRLLQITPDIKLCRIDSLQLSLFVSDKEDHPEQEWSPIVGEEDPVPPQIKEEEVDLTAIQEEEHIQSQKADIIEFQFPSHCVKTEYDQEGPLQSVTPPQTELCEIIESDSEPVDTPFVSVPHLKGLNMLFDPPGNLNDVFSNSTALLHVYLNDRLTAAAVEIFGAVVKTVSEYQEENERLRRLLRLTPDLTCRIDTQQFSLAGSEEIPPEQQHFRQDWSPIPRQEDSEFTQIKEEQEEIGTSLVEEQLRGLESDNIEFSFSPPCMKNECDQEKPLVQPMTLPQTQTGENRQSDCEPVDAAPFVPQLKGLDIDFDHPGTVKNTFSNNSAVSSYPLGHDSSLPMEFNPPLDPNPSLEKHHMKPTMVPRKIHRCCDCSERFALKADLQEHVTHAKKRPSECRFCKKRYNSTCKLKAHVQLCHVEKPCTCPFCGKTFKHKGAIGLISREEIINLTVAPLRSAEFCGTFSLLQLGRWDAAFTF
ncbi:hypothetical protein DPEC_G00176570 [Dallia pectoralis]|uniref:Uncharacterized protein n=1 Tax=Dallia pectoralis TaxID=75939 RepID=A0ACC2GEQ2_DALPE|nr:hypothetical protein DPEC_G00176570 [Dallia pectoralis]